MTAHRIRIWFHWSTFLLVAAAYAIALARAAMDDPDQRLFWLDCHRTIGLAILALTVLRLVGRVVLPFERVHETKWLLRLGARATHVMIYLGMLAMPLLGWAQSSAKMHKFKLFGARFPRIFGHDRQMGDWLGVWHENLAWTMLALIGLHSAAALYHHFVRRDHVLVDMLRTREPA